MKKDEIQLVKEWWMAKSEADFERAIRGLSEYGSSDLDAMGDVLVRMGMAGNGERGWNVVSTRIGSVGAIGFYVLGKVTRWLGATKAGELPSNDTLLDVTVYSMMARFVVEHGAWSLGVIKDD